MNQRINQKKFRKTQHREKMMEIMAEKLRDTKDNMRKYNLSQISKRKGKDDGKDTEFEELLFSVMPSNYLILCCPLLL